jgi:hypothetical protein
VLVDALVLGVDLLLTLGVAGCAFTQSFFSIRAMLIVLGQNPDVAPLWPIGVDLSLVCSTLALLSLASPENDADRAAAALLRFGQPAAGNGAHVAEAGPAAGVVNAGPSSPERRLWWDRSPPSFGNAALMFASSAT